MKDTNQLINEAENLFDDIKTCNDLNCPDCNTRKVIINKVKNLLHSLEKTVREDEKKKQTQYYEWIAKEIGQWVVWHKQNLEGWKEPDGYLIPTEPSPEEREIVREGLRGAIDALERVINMLPIAPVAKESLSPTKEQEEKSNAK